MNSQFPTGYSNLAGYSVMHYKNEFPAGRLYKHGGIFDDTVLELIPNSELTGYVNLGGYSIMQINIEFPTPSWQGIQT